MHTTLDWTTPLTWFIASASVILLLVQGWLIIRNKLLSSNRKWVRLCLNVLLWLVLVGYALHISWPVSRPATHALLVADEVPSAMARQVKDSLGINDSFTSRNFKADYDSVTLVGQQFPIETLTQLSNANVQWIPYNRPDQLQTIRWKSIVRQGEMQRVIGLMQSTKKQILRLRFGSQTLDSIALHIGENTFALHFPAFARGRSQVALEAGGKVVDTLHFFTRPTQPMAVQFILNSPDFESKTVANWLGKHGHTVDVSATLSKNISSNLSLNKGKTFVPDLIITEPVNAASSTVRKAIAEGKAILFINLTNPETELRAINQATGSQFQARKTANDDLAAVGNTLKALPYRFAEPLNQFRVAEYPIAVQRGNGRVGVSLLSETFPLALSGDSVAYTRIWTAVLARLSANRDPAVLADAPLYYHIGQDVLVNTVSGKATDVAIGQDTIQLYPSPMNAGTETAFSFFPKTGWQPVQDSLAVFVNDLKPEDNLANRAVVRRFMLAHARHQSPGTRPAKTRTAQVPDWVWLLLFLGCFTALWVEPKLAF